MQFFEKIAISSVIHLMRGNTIFMLFIYNCRDTACVYLAKYRD